MKKISFLSGSDAAIIFSMSEVVNLPSASVGKVCVYRAISGIQSIVICL